jgi:co-chaperonin GroES (HSP10)
MIKRGTTNSVLVELEKLSDNEYVLSSGVKLFMDTSYKPEQHQRIYGKCVAVPEILTKSCQVKYEQGDFRFADSIVPEVQIGDIVYFSYIVVNKFNLLEYEGKSYCNIPYSEILCVVRYVPTKISTTINEHIGSQHSSTTKVIESERVIIPIGGNIMCEEYYGKDAEMIEVNGFKIHVVNSKSSTLITDIVKKASNSHGRVKIVGEPLKGDVMEMKPEDLITFPEKFGFKNNIEGTDYLFLKYWDVHGILEEEKV